ncbi:MAG: hypothetical protein HKN36_13840 [Hellea sp.]|nr:hypothetical protein [Hellea sp.]
MSVKDRVIFVPRGPRGRQGPAGPTGNPSVETARIDDIESVDPGNNAIFVDGVNGNDLNFGSAVTSPVATLQRAITLCRSFGFNYINILSDITLDYRIAIDHLNGVLFLRGRNSDSSAAMQRKITVVDSSNNGSRPGCFVINSNMSVRLEALDIELNSGKGFGVFEVTVAYLQFYMINGSLSRVGTGNARLFHTGIGSISANFASFTLDYSALGYLFYSVISGADPNDHYNYFTNISSA